MARALCVHPQLPVTSQLLLLGVGGGALAHFLQAALPRARVHAVDNDADVLDVATSAFAVLC